MKKEIRIFTIVENRRLNDNYALLRLTPNDGELLPQTLPGQFVQVKVDGSETTFLRRPISINYVDVCNNEIWLLIRKAGSGTECLISKNKGEVLNLILPLGNGFTIPDNKNERILLVGGGVGVAPMLQYGSVLKKEGFSPEFLLGARSASDLLELDHFQSIGPVHVSTDDGTLGEAGVVTVNSILKSKWDRIACCGPAPMMKAVAGKAREIGARCEVSLENMMACGLGACLCCVEKTVKGNICVCTKGPVFDIEQLTW